MRTKNVGRIRVKMDDERLRSRVWGAWSIRRAAICIANLAEQLADGTPRTAERILQLAAEALAKEQNNCDDSNDVPDWQQPICEPENKEE